MFLFKNVVLTQIRITSFGFLNEFYNTFERTSSSSKSHVPYIEYILDADMICIFKLKIKSKNSH
ncbi:hypothetical protein PIROE2DRAFT_13897 [Piromyces sp. E2]|nr:hypothetical protein PIROE2DRAFT_13897 [Piromyces sp. E2]|eukprot:OUM60352.1 hypothetical protein PIROE2DRAFT_13897 [Piromyces sp. E2]